MQSISPCVSQTRFRFNSLCLFDDVVVTNGEIKVDLHPSRRRLSVDQPGKVGRSTVHRIRRAWRSTRVLKPDLKDSTVAKQAEKVVVDILPGQRHRRAAINEHSAITEVDGVHMSFSLHHDDRNVCRGARNFRARWIDRVFSVRPDRYCHRMQGYRI